VEESRVLIDGRTVRLLAVIMVLSLGVIANPSHLLPMIPHFAAQGTQTPTSSTKVFIAPSNVTDLTKSSGSITFNVNVSDAPSFNAFAVVIYYNRTALQATSLDYSNSVLGSNSKVVIYCVDETAPATLSCDPQFAAIGEIALSLNILSGSTGNVTSAKTLFQIKFDVAAIGFSQIHIYSASLGLIVVSNDPLADYVFNTFDGFFTNQPCGGGACQPPIVRVSSQPNPAPKDSLVTFNVNVTEPSVAAKALSYRWDWGDGTQADRQTNTTVVPLGKPISHQFLASRYGLGTQCVSKGLCLVELTIFDSRGVSWETTVRVQILLLNIVLTVFEPEINPQFHVVPGTVVNVNARIDNSGNVAENATLTIRLENIKSLNSRYFPQLAASGGEGSLNATLDTSGFLPRAYAIVAEISNTSSAQRIQGDFIHSLNASSRRVAVGYVLVVSPLITGALSLGLLQTTGLGILIFVAAVIAIARLLKKPSYLEPL
jgi:hypothetical protein